MAFRSTARVFGSEAWTLHEKAKWLWTTLSGLLVVGLGVLAGVTFGLPWGLAAFMSGLFVWSTATGLALAAKLSDRDLSQVIFEPRVTSLNGAWTLRIGVRNRGRVGTFTGTAEWTNEGLPFAYVPVGIVWSSAGPGERQIRTNEVADIDLLHIRPEGDQFSCDLWATLDSVNGHRKVVPHDDVEVKVTVWCAGKDAPQSALVSIDTSDPNTPQPRVLVI